MRALFLLFLLSISNQVSAQVFVGEAEIPRVEADGFYRILISPALSPYLNSEFSNSRIYDQHKQEVPYLFQKETPIRYTKSFKEYEIVEKKQTKNCCTTIILKNPDNNAINNINLSIKNAEVTKYASLLGSDDQKNWFALKEHFILSNLDGKDKTSKLKIIDFPLSNYYYYQLQIEDSTSSPINILSAGYYELSSEDGTYVEVKSFKLVKSDSASHKKSYIQINFDSIRVIDKLNISFSGPPYYLRKASLLIKRQRKDKKGKTISYYEKVSDFEISSKQESVLEFSGLRAGNLLVTIENEDNPILEIASFKTYELNRYFVSWLTKDSQYKLKIGKPNIQPPIYDLEFFKESIPKAPEILVTRTIKIFDKPKSRTETTVFTNKAIIWIAIIAVITIMGVMSVKLIRETATKKD